MRGRPSWLRGPVQSSNRRGLSEALPSPPKYKWARVADQVRHWTENPVHGGSNPSPRTIKNMGQYSQRTNLSSPLQKYDLIPPVLLPLQIIHRHNVAVLFFDINESIR